MRRGVLGTLAVVASLAIGTGASATTPPTGQNDPITGAGPSGSVHALPLCPVNTYVDPQSGRSCLPLGVPIPEETTKLATDAPCAATGELEGFFTDPSQTVAMIECFLPLMGTWITQEWPARGVAEGPEQLPAVRHGRSGSQPRSGGDPGLPVQSRRRAVLLPVGRQRVPRRR